MTHHLPPIDQRSPPPARKTAHERRRPHREALIGAVLLPATFAALLLIGILKALIGDLALVSLGVGVVLLAGSLLRDP